MNKDKIRSSWKSKNDSLLLVLSHQFIGFVISSICILARGQVFVIFLVKLGCLFAMLIVIVLCISELIK